MSQWRGRLEENPELESAADWVTNNYQIPVVALLIAFMLWSRLRSWRNYVVDGQVLFEGHDAWYHYRTTTYAVRNWPSNMPFDPWTYFPYGNASGQFGTLFDQIVATVALIVGLGNPSDHTIAMTLLVAPAFFGAACAIPTYFIARRIGGRVAGVTAVTVLAFSVGSFYSRSRVGFSDHHVAEALFMAVGVLAVMVAVTVAQRDKPIYEQVAERDFESLRPTLLWGALAGVAISLYMWVWPFGVLLVGIVGAFLFVQMNAEVVRGESPEHTAFAGAVTLGVTGLALLSSVKTTAFVANDFSILQPLTALLVAGGCVFMAWLAREWEARDLSPATYPVTTVGIIVVGAVLAAFLVPDTFEYLTRQLNRIFGLGFDVSGTGGTVGEVQPLVDWEQEGLGAGVQQLYSAYGFAVFMAFIGAVTLLVRQFGENRDPAQYTFVLVWTIFITAATFTQGRFQYYLVFPVAVLTGYVVSIVIDWIDFDAGMGLRDIDSYQALTIIAVALIILAPIAPTAMVVGSPDFNGPDNDVRAWDDGLDWMNSNTPAEGEFDGGNSELDHYGTFERQDNYDYSAGEYGVLSWWDYGHYITVLGERIPNANPFQQGATSAANFLVAPNESQANDVMDGLSEEDAETRYVAVDWKMASARTSTLVDGQARSTNGKLFAPIQFYNQSDVSRSDFFQSYVYDSAYQDENRVLRSSFPVRHQPYYDSMAVRLYHFHGSAVEPQPIVLELGQPTEDNPVAPPAQVEVFDNMTAAREYAEDNPNAQVGGFGAYPSERVPALENYRLVGASETSATTDREFRLGAYAEARGTGSPMTAVENESDCTSEFTLRSGSGGYICLPEETANSFYNTPPRWTKMFERVPGATIEGTGPANQTVSAQVEMQMPDSNETFTYQQSTETDADGSFTMTVPYSTTGYDEWGVEEGQTNVSVRATGPYEFQTIDQADNGTLYGWTGNASVSEGQVLGKDDSATTVELERSTLFDPNQASEDANETTANETGADEGEPEADDTETNEQDGNASESLAAPVAE